MGLPEAPVTTVTASLIGTSRLQPNPYQSSLVSTHAHTHTHTTAAASLAIKLIFLEHIKLYEG